MSYAYYGEVLKTSFLWRVTARDANEFCMGERWSGGIGQSGHATLTSGKLLEVELVEKTTMGGVEYYTFSVHDGNLPSRPYEGDTFELICGRLSGTSLPKKVAIWLRQHWPFGRKQKGAR